MVKQLVLNKTLVPNKKEITNNNLFINIYIYKSNYSIDYDSYFY